MLIIVIVETHGAINKSKKKLKTCLSTFLTGCLHSGAKLIGADRSLPQGWVELLLKPRVLAERLWREALNTFKIVLILAGFSKLHIVALSK